MEEVTKCSSLMASGKKNLNAVFGVGNDPTGENFINYLQNGTH